MKWTYEFIPASVVSAGIKTQWHERVEAEGNVFQFPEIISAWCETIGRNRTGDLFLFYAKSEIGHSIILPFWCRYRRKYGLKQYILEGIGGEIQYDYQNPIPLEGEWSDYAWHTFWESFIKASLQHFGGLSIIELRRLSVPVPDEIKYSYYDQDLSPYLNIPDGNDPLGSVIVNCGSSHRGNVRRRMREAAKIGCVSVEKVDVDLLDLALEEMFEAHIVQWNKNGMKSQFESEDSRVFFKRLCHSAQSIGKLHFSRLRVGEEVWHWLIAFLHRGELLWYKPAYSVNHGKHSPGLIHLACLIESSRQVGISRIDFGYGGEVYKFLWTKDMLALHGIRYPTRNGFMLMSRINYYRSRLGLPKWLTRNSGK